MTDGPVVIVTGSTRGIGRAIAERFAADGWSCLVNGRGPAAADDRLIARGQAVHVQADVSGAAGARLLVDAALERWGRLDAVINNAAVTTRIPHRDLDAVDDDLWDQVLRTNVVGPWHVARAAAPALKRSPHGAIINISSLAGRRAAGSCIPYAVSKAALDQLTVLLSAALAPEIRVNAVAPGFIDNDRGDVRDDVRELVSKRAPLRRPGLPDEVADVCAFLATAMYVTGDVVVVDGGLHVR